MRSQVGYQNFAPLRRLQVEPRTALALILAVTVAGAAWAKPPDRTATKEELDKNLALLKKSQTHASKIKSDLERVAKERAKLDQNLIRTGELIKESEAKMTAIEGRLGDLEAREDRLRTSLRHQHRSLAGLLSALQRMGHNPPPVMITRRRDALAMVRSAMLLAHAFPKLRGRATRLAGQIKQLAAVIDGIRKERNDLRAETLRLTVAQRNLSYLMQTKRQSHNLRRLELAKVERSVRQIGDKVETLEQLLASLGPENGELAVPSPLASSVSAAPYNLVPVGGRFIAGRPLSPAIAFHEAKGQLPLPAAGRIEQDFGEPAQYGGRSKGILIKTRYGAQITSPCDGVVLFAGKFRTYGQLLIIKAGAGYHVLLAGLSGIDVQPGQFVLMGEPVGTMKRSPGQRAGPDSPRLYVEFRKDGRPINPGPWWSDSSVGKV